MYLSTKNVKEVFNYLTEIEISASNVFFTFLYRIYLY